MKRWVVISVLLPALAACTPAGNGNADAAPQNNVDASARVLMERLPCYGTCPVYSVSVAADGTVTFQGEQHVDSLGTHVITIPRAEAGALMRELENAGFFQLQPKYTYPEKACGAYHTDAPRVNVTLMLNGRTGRVEHDHGCDGAPRVLRQLQDRIDSAAGVARWTGVR